MQRFRIKNILKAKLKLVYLKLNKGDFTKTFLDELDTQNRQAARSWLRAVVTHVPVYTGEARGSLRPLGQFLRVAIPISPSKSRHAQYLMSKGHTAAAGEAQGSFQFVRGPRAQFIFKTKVAHYLINEFFDVSDYINLIQPVPWYSFRYGKDAYRKYMKENLKKKLPKLSSYILREIREIS